MRQSIVYHGQYYSRACLPSEALRGTDAVARLWPAHSDTVHNFNPRNFAVGKAKVRSMPDMLNVGTRAFEFVRNKCDLVRVIDDGYIRLLDELDEQIIALRKKTEALTEEAFDHGRPVTKAEAEIWRQQVVAKRGTVAPT